MYVTNAVILKLIGSSKVLLTPIRRLLEGRFKAREKKGSDRRKLAESML